MIDVSAPNCPQDETNNNININSSFDLPLYNSTNWQYILQSTSMHEIIPGLFLGAYNSAEKHSLNILLDNDIRYIICVRQEIEAHIVRPHFHTDPSFTYLTLDIEDHATENIIRFFPKVKEFIDEGISKNVKVLVHGKEGNSRSATLVSAYIMEKFGLTSDEAIRYVKTKRETVSPNEGFVAQLIEYEPIYKARQCLNQGEPSCDNRRQKRKCEQLSETLEYDLIQPPPSPNTDNNNEDPYQNIQDFSNHLYKLLLKR